MTPAEAPPGAPSGAPLAEIAYGVTKAVLEALWRGLTSIPDRLTNREIAFVGDPETRRNVKEKLKTAEYATLSRYVVDESLWAIVASGLSLRDLEADPVRRPRLEGLRSAIHEAHGDVGVRLAEVVQRGMLTDLITQLEKSGASEKQIRDQLETVLADLMSHLEFVQAGHDPRELARKISYKVSLRSPQIVLGRGYAGDTVRRVATKLREFPGLKCEIHESDGQTYLLVLREDQWVQFQEDRRASAPATTKKKQG